MTIRIGIIGAGWIVPLALIDPAKKLESVVVQAIAARDKGRAKAFAEEHDIPHVADNYNALLAREDIDLVYIALPVSLHHHWTIAALEAGKHVLCEKPLAMNAREAKEMADAAVKSNKYLVEAFHYRHHPFFNRIIQIARSNEIGTIKQIHGRLHVPVPPKKGQIRLDPTLGGGALMDLGCYPIHMTRNIIGKEPEVVQAKAVIGTTGVDLAMNASLRFPGNILAEIDCAMPEQGEISGCLRIEGANGVLEATRPILPHTGGAITVSTNTSKRTEAADPTSTYCYQLRAIGQMIQTTSPASPSLTDSLNNAVTIDEIKRNAGLLTKMRILKTPPPRQK